MGTTVFTANMKNRAIKELAGNKLFQQVKILKEYSKITPPPLFFFLIHNNKWSLHA
jgi:hypothetical protein